MLNLCRHSFTPIVKMHFWILAFIAGMEETCKDMI